MWGWTLLNSPGRRTRAYRVLPRASRRCLRRSPKCRGRSWELPGGLTASWTFSRTPRRASPGRCRQLSRMLCFFADNHVWKQTSWFEFRTFKFQKHVNTQTYAQSGVHLVYFIPNVWGTVPSGSFGSSFSIAIFEIEPYAQGGAQIVYLQMMLSFCRMPYGIPCRTI